MDTHLTKPADQSTTDLGRRVRAARQAQDLTLETASRLCGVSRSTLSKVENGLMSPTFDVLQKIVLGLKIEIGELFGSTPKVSASGRRALTRKNEGQRHAYRGYQMELLATDLAHKAMLPFRIRISAHTLDAFDDWFALMDETMAEEPAEQIPALLAGADHGANLALGVNDAQGVA